MHCSEYAVILSGDACRTARLVIKPFSHSSGSYHFSFPISHNNYDLKLQS